jgi:putative zinc finger protein
VQGNGRGTPDDTPVACIDAETLAAWADGSLPRAEAAVVETHLADCERCTAMLATFARTIPDAPVTEPLWKRWHLRWLIPVATAATVAALWVLVPSPESTQMRATGTVARRDAQAAIESQASAPSGAPQLATPSETKEQEARLRVAQSKSADAVAKREAPSTAPGQLADARGDRDEKLQQPLPLNESVTIAPAAPVPDPAREADRAEAKSTDAQTERFSPALPSANAAPGAQAPAAQTPAASTASPAREAAAARAPAPAATQPTFRAPAESRAGGALAREQPAIIEIASPDPMIRWRVVGTGRVEHSTNGGARWQPATLPESATLIAGSSPSASICWLVGRAGAIYVTTDGLRFVRVPFTDRTDFVSIRATDGRHATVVTIDGRTMRTEDQGVTWIRVNP